MDIFAIKQNISIVFNKNYTIENRISELANIIASKKIETIRSESLLSSIINKETTTNNTNLKFGLKSALYSFDQDMKYYSYIECSKISYDDLKLKTKDLEQVIIKLENSSRNESGKIIEVEILNLSVVTAFLFMAIILLTLFIYVRMISRDIHRLNCIKVVLNVFSHSSG